MSYLAQQAGGLTDFQFEEDPSQSLRERNWFKVRWNLPSISLDYQLSERTKMTSKFFALLGTRQALGNLQPPTRLDAEPFQNRDLIVDFYENYGNETRVLHRYSIGNQRAALAGGIRLYQGFTEKTQGFGSDRKEADFQFVTEDLKLKSDYDFPSKNVAAFVENLFYITNKLTVTPGLRYEYIHTTANGFLR